MQLSVQQDDDGDRRLTAWGRCKVCGFYMDAEGARHSDFRAGTLESASGPSTRLARKLRKCVVRRYGVQVANDPLKAFCN